MITSLLLSLGFCAGPVPMLHYVVKSESRTWQPIEAEALDKILDAATVPALSELAAFRMQKTGFVDLKKGDYTLLIEGRFIEESEQFSVYLTFGPGVSLELPSLVVSETAEIGRRNVQEMQKVVEGLSKQASAKLMVSLREALKTPHLGLPNLDTETFSWGAVKVDRPKDTSGPIGDLVDPRHPDHVRANAARTLAEHAVDQPQAARALEWCVLRDPTSTIRVQCANGLAPLARTRVPTQRILLRAMRQEPDENALGAMVVLGKGFVGLSRKEALATWLDLIAEDRTPAHGAGKAADLLHDEGQVPGLEVAVARCLLQDALAYGKKSACAGLFRMLPEAQRAAVAAPYLRRVRAFSQGESMVADEIIEQLAKGKKNQVVAGLFMEVLQRPTAGRARHKATSELARVSEPDRESVAKVTPYLLDADVAYDVLQLLGEWARAKPELVEDIAASVAAAKEKMTGIAKRYRGDPRQRSDELLKSLDSLRKRKPT